MNNYIILAILIIAVGVSSIPVNSDPINITKKDGMIDDYFWGNFSECSHTCDGGFMTRDKYCLSGKTMTTFEWCDVEYYECNLKKCDDPFEGQLFTPCSKSCGGGFRSRISSEGVVHEIRCNTQMCELKEGKCEADIIFVMDSSATIGDSNFYVVKQFAMDIVSALPISDKLTHVGAFSYSSRVVEQLNLGDVQDKETIKDKLWKLPYMAGMTNTADALKQMTSMSNSHKGINKTQVAIILTDGHSNVDPTRTIKEAGYAHNDGISVIVIGIGLAIDDAEMKGMASNDKSYYSVTDVNAIMDITDILVKDTCSKPVVTCEECIYSKCSAKCGEKGYITGYKTCKTVYKETTSIKNLTCKASNCIGECTGPTTTTIASTTTPMDFAVNCNKCNFTAGQIWRPDVSNCHGYYVCEPTATKGKFRIHHMSCNELYWNQAISTCVRKPQPGCDASATPFPTVTSGVTTQAPLCTYVTNPKNPRQFKPKKGKFVYQLCPQYTHFDDSNEMCTCVPDSGHPNACKSNMLLHFPYDSHLNDVTCTKAQSVLVGEKVNLVVDSVRGKVAQFNGKGYLEVPYMRKYFSGNTIEEFTIAYFFKRTSDSKDQAVIVSNGDCLETSTFESGYNNGKAYYQGRSIKNEITEDSLQDFKVNTWYHVAWVYTGHELILYVDGNVVSSKPLTGGLLNTDVPMDVGARCGEFYHTGLIDELQVYKRKLSASSIKVLSHQ